MHGNAKKWREKMGEIIFGVIGIGIISAAILNIVSTQRMWTKKPAAYWQKSILYIIPFNI